MLHMFGFINPFFMNLNKSSGEQNGKKEKKKKKKETEFQLKQYSS